MSAADVTFDEGATIMVEHGYRRDMFDLSWETWLQRGDVVLIFQNEDFCHPDLGHVTTMPWEADKELPPHGPDHAALGLGWRYITKYVIRSR